MHRCNVSDVNCHAHAVPYMLQATRCATGWVHPALALVAMNVQHPSGERSCWAVPPSQAAAKLQCDMQAAVGAKKEAAAGHSSRGAPLLPAHSGQQHARVSRPHLGLRPALQPAQPLPSLILPHCVHPSAYSLCCAVRICLIVGAIWCL